MAKTHALPAGRTCTVALRSPLTRTTSSWGSSMPCSAENTIRFACSLRLSNLRRVGEWG